MKHVEADLQRQVASYLSWCLPKTAWFTSVAHGTRLDSSDDVAWRRGVQSKRAGTKPGVPDILVVYQGKAFWCELKSDTGSLSVAQRETRADLINAGCEWTVARSLDQVVAALMAWQIPIRTSKPVTAALKAQFEERGHRDVTQS